MTTEELDTLLTALYGQIDDHLPRTRWLGRPSRLTDSELVCLAVARVLLGFHADWPGYGCSRSHSRWFWGLKLHLVRTPAGLPVTWALASPKIDRVPWAPNRTPLR